MSLLMRLNRDSNLSIVEPFQTTITRLYHERTGEPTGEWRAIVTGIAKRANGTEYPAVAWVGESRDKRKLARLAAAEVKRMTARST